MHFVSVWVSCSSTDVAAVSERCAGEYLHTEVMSLFNYGGSGRSGGGYSDRYGEGGLGARDYSSGNLILFPAN